MGVFFSEHSVCIVLQFHRISMREFRAMIASLLLVCFLRKNCFELRDVSLMLVPSFLSRIIGVTVDQSTLTNNCQLLAC